MRARAGLGVLLILGLFALQCGGSDEGSEGSGGGGTGAAGGSGGIDIDAAFGGGGPKGGTGGVGAGGTGTGATGTGATGGDAGPPKPCSTNSECNDGAYCNGLESCDNGFCKAGNPITCPDDGKTCTVEACSEATFKCETVLSDTVCQNGLFCDGVESCKPTDPAADATTGCVKGTALVCTDAFSCTIDSCDEATKGCKNLADDTKCANTVFCDGDEVCDPTTGDPTTGCRAGTKKACDDGRSCTVDSCDEANKKCVSTPDNTVCNNGKYCDGQETCSLTGPTPSGCVAGTPVTCAPDAYVCTVEACDETKQSYLPAIACATSFNHAACQTGEQCTVAGCKPSIPCSSSTECNDGNACNGVETCDLTIGKCVFAAPKNCNDGIPCTVDSCVAPGTCVNTPVNAACDDANVCNGSEVCNAATGCMAGTTLNCDDGVSCTFDSCTPGSGCTHAAQDAACSDNNACNGVEKCDPVAGCKSSGAATCPSDGIACTKEQCNPVTGKCESVPDNSLCPCGQVCSAKQGGCGQFCQQATCQGKLYQCGDCVDNDGDCKIDAFDSACLGACQNNETGYFGDIPGQNNAPCKADCYFDQDSGSGNDDCYWSHECDPLAVAPNYPPEGSSCKYSPNASIPGTSMTCAQAQKTQSNACLGFCGPLTPNGCDCFGCCVFPNVATPVWLGAVDGDGNGTCDLASVNNPAKCPPCTQVTACLNTCGTCEICVGKPTLPPECGGTQQCPTGVQACGLPGQLPCPAGTYCVTGCCQKTVGQ